MTKKDYAIIAKAINDVRVTGVVKARHVDHEDAIRTSGVEVALLDLALTLATELRKDNPLFDRGRFFKACGFDPQ